MKDSLRLAAFACGLALSLPALAGEPAKGAKALIRSVHEAAATKDYATLSSLMISEFTWSFGGDASAEQALGEWRKDPSQLEKLARITAVACATQSDGTVECPKTSRAGARAGFKKTSAGWRMTFLVEGD